MYNLYQSRYIPSLKFLRIPSVARFPSLNMNSANVAKLRLRSQVDLLLSKAPISLDPNNLQLHCFIALGTLFCCSFFCHFDQSSKTLQTVQVAPFRHALYSPKTYQNPRLNIIVSAVSSPIRTKMRACAATL